MNLNRERAVAKQPAERGGWQQQYVVRGAVGRDWGGAPTFWNKVSDSGRSTTPVTVAMTAGRPARWMRMVSPGRLRRLAAVCCPSSTPVSAPVSVRICCGKVLR